MKNVARKMPDLVQEITDAGSNTVTNADLAPNDEVTIRLYSRVPAAAM